MLYQLWSRKCTILIFQRLFSISHIVHWRHVSWDIELLTRHSSTYWMQCHANYLYILRWQKLILLKNSCFSNVCIRPSAHGRDMYVKIGESIIIMLLEFFMWSTTWFSKKFGKFELFAVEVEILSYRNELHNIRVA